MFLVVIIVICNLFYGAVVALVKEISDLNGSYLLKYKKQQCSTWQTGLLQYGPPRPGAQISQSQ